MGFIHTLTAPLNDAVHCGEKERNEYARLRGEIDYLRNELTSLHISSALLGFGNGCQNLSYPLAAYFSPGDSRGDECTRQPPIPCTGVCSDDVKKKNANEAYWNAWPPIGCSMDEFSASLTTSKTSGAVCRNPIKMKEFSPRAIGFPKAEKPFASAARCSTDTYNTNGKICRLDAGVNKCMWRQRPFHTVEGPDTPGSPRLQRSRYSSHAMYILACREACKASALCNAFVHDRIRGECTLKMGMETSPSDQYDGHIQPSCQWKMEMGIYVSSPIIPGSPTLEARHYSSYGAYIESCKSFCSTLDDCQAFSDTWYMYGFFKSSRRCTFHTGTSTMWGSLSNAYISPKPKDHCPLGTVCTRKPDIFGSDVNKCKASCVSDNACASFEYVQIDTRYAPTQHPTKSPTNVPTLSPTTSSPTSSPTLSPSNFPTASPTVTHKCYYKPGMVAFAAYCVPGDTQERCEHLSAWCEWVPHFSRRV